jgi:hypothetical protein
MFWLKRIKDHYLVLIDTLPPLAVTGAVLIGRLSGTTFVFNAMETRLCKSYGKYDNYNYEYN